MSLKAVRQQLVLSQDEIAEVTGVDIQTVARWEAGLEHMPLKKARLLQAKYELPLTFFRRNSGAGSDDEDALAAHLSMAKPEATADAPRGTIRVRLLDRKGRSSFRSKDRKHAYVWPITQVEWASITHHLEAGTIHSDAPAAKDWLVIESLDDRLIFINKSAIECIELIDDNTAPMPPYFTKDLYEALQAPTETHSPEQLKAVAMTISDLGGPFEARKLLREITIERLAGRRLSLPFEQEHAEDLLSSLMNNDQPAVHRIGLLSSGRRSDELHYRFGALRLIEVSKQRWTTLMNAAREA